MSAVLTDDMCIKKYGSPENKQMLSYIKTYPLPTNVINNIKMFNKSKKITIHQDMKPMLFNALNYIADNGLGSLLTEWGGSFCIRKIRGVDTEWSIHSWALAFDVNMSTNGLNSQPHLDARIIAVFKDNGFDWGGDFHRKDGMHFQVSLKSFNSF